MKKGFLVILTVVVLLLGLRTYLRYVNKLERQTRFLMDTYVTIYAAGPKPAARAAINAALDRIDEIDKKMNPLNPASEVWAFNEQGKEITDPEIVEVIKTALKVSEETQGAFDITVYPLAKLWGFDTKNYRLPQDPEIKETLRNVDYKYIEVKDNKVRKLKNKVQIDLGGIAKGYSVGEAEKVLKEMGITSALIDAGGDIYAVGKKNKKPWKVGLKAPRGDFQYNINGVPIHRDDDLLGYITLEDNSVACSGDYERFFEKDGVRYCHIFDPKTGYPAKEMQAVYIIYPNCVLTDAWSKVFVLGPQKGMDVVDGIDGMEAVMIDSAGKTLFSKNFKHNLRLEK